MLSAHALELERQEREAERARLISIGIRHLAHKRAEDRARVEASLQLPAPVGRLVYANDMKRSCPMPAPRIMSNARRYAFDGKELTLLQWSRNLGIAKVTLEARLFRGWTIERVLSTPARPKMDAEDRGRKRRPGVVSDFGPFSGTGGGRTAQDTTKITFSEKAKNQ